MDYSKTVSMVLEKLHFLGFLN